MNGKAPPLVSARFWRVSVPYLEEWICSPEFGTHPDSDRLIVELKDADGNSGWGEGVWRLSPEDTRTALSFLLQKSSGEFRASFLDILWEPGKLYWQHPLPPSPFAQAPEKLRHRLRHPLQTAVETALTDLATRRAEVPFSAWFGGSWRDRVAADYWAGRVTPEQAARCARRALDLGFHGIKLKTALEDPNVGRLEAVKAAADRNFTVTLDPNGRFHRLDDAWPVLKEMDTLGNLGTVEDPFPRTALADTRELRRRLNARVAIHIDPPESLAQVIAADCCGGLNIDSHTQGLFQWRMQAAAADQFNIPVWHGGSLDLGIYTAAQLHLAAATPNCELPGDQAGPWLRHSTLVREPFQVVEGCVIVPPGPGLGVTPDLDEIERYAKFSAAIG